MPIIAYRCDNHDVCHNYIEKPGLCLDCQRAARELERALKESQRLEQAQIVYKNEGLRFHRKR